MSSTSPIVETLGQHALLLRLGDAVDLDTSARVHALVARLEAERPRAVREIVPAYAAVAVEFGAGSDAARVREELRAWLAEAAATLPVHQVEAAGDVRAAGAVDVGVDADAAVGIGFGADATTAVIIPVRYDGPDLDPVARHAGMTVGEAVRRHSAPLYTVAMLGFAPGFPYLLGMDPVLAMPRLDTPRSQVPAGSVGIAEAQTGIYPQTGPGGWRLLGHTDLRLFAADADPPALLRAGMRVRFCAL